ncbi:YdcF family protein [Mycoplasma sp. P36-A1]|uniref:YdcF family protein n=1 Tax=Mycoplasma sp. P36-A1 TaxID=3252900 RepID=UPI003C2F9663
MKKNKKIFLGILVFIIGVFSFITVQIKIHSNDEINNDLDYLIVLGAKINGDKPSLDLKSRLDKAIKVYYKTDEPIIIVSGGQGKDEDYTEASIMKKYLVARNIPTNNVIEEDKSTNTNENFKYTKDILEKLDSNYTNKNIGFVTSDYHVARSLMLSRRNLATDHIIGQAASSASKGGIVREIFAYIKSFIFDS